MSQAAIDAGAFAELKGMMGDAFAEILNLFLQSLPEQLSGIETAIQNTDAKQLFNLAHKMKSSSGSIGAFGLAEKAEALELIGRKGSTDVSQQALSELQDAASQVITILKDELRT